ncbi:hypothetical protein Ahy_A08g038529 [Arachis hypogaea]|uniref:Transposase MuDR plant domain-containing protein n=1 Tax=Arachis hypogaea TaxID=3818 RepID=A0A445BTP9_ARAHY|nr:hypothetical protein Ahy_A08g038529 [Arachis hypogaea]
MYIEFEQSEADRNAELEDYNSDSEEEFESNYEVVDPGGDEDQTDSTLEADVTEVANALANQHLFVEPTFMRSLDLEAMHAPKFPQYMNVEPTKSLVEVDPSINVKSFIVKVQSKFNYTISYRKAWLPKQMAVESIFGYWEASYEALPI